MKSLKRTTPKKVTVEDTNIAKEVSELKDQSKAMNEAILYSIMK